MMGEGWTRERFRKERFVCKCKKGVVEFIFLWFCSRVVVGSYNIRMVTSDLVFYFSLNRIQFPVRTCRERRISVIFKVQHVLHPFVLNIWDSDRQIAPKRNTSV